MAHFRTEAIDSEHKRRNAKQRAMLEEYLNSLVGATEGSEVRVEHAGVRGGHPTTP